MEYYLELDFSYQFVSGVITFLMVFSILLLIGIMISRTIKNREEKQSNRWHAEFQELLVSLLFEPEHVRGGKKYKETIIKYKADKLDRIARKALIGEMMELHKGVKGDSEFIIKQLYRDVGLVKFQADQINKGPWWQKAYAFRVYSEFGVVEKIKLVRKYVDHPNRILRSEAQYAVVSLQGAAGLTFVQKLKSPISEWEQLVLLEKLIKFRPEDLPDVKSWLHSKNTSVVVFATKIIHQFRLFENRTELLELLTHPNQEVVLHVIECIVRIEYKDACSRLKRLYPDAHWRVKEKILNALSRLGDRSNLEFFKNEIEEANEYPIVMASAKALKNLNALPILQQLDRQELKYPKNNEIVKHALDQRI